MSQVRPDTEAFHALLTLLQEHEQQFLHHRGQSRDEEFVDGYRTLFDLLSLGIDNFLHNDPERPHLVSIITPYRKLGGDNAHALYFLAPLRPDRAYLLRGRMNSAIYMGFTVYGGDSQEKVHITSNHNASDLRLDGEGRFSLVLSPLEQDGRAPVHARLAPESHTLIVREYFAGKDKRGEADLELIPLDNPGPPPLLTGEVLASRIRQMTSFLKGWLAMSPMPWPVQEEAYNQACPPFRATESTGHWSTPDNLHSFGFFKLEPDEALIVRGQSPDCLYWSCHLWNAGMQTFNWKDYDCHIAGKDVQLNPDGSWTLVVAHRDPGVPNWLNTTGYQRGFLYFRWLMAEGMPSAIDCTRVPLAEVRQALAG